MKSKECSQTNELGYVVKVETQFIVSFVSESLWQLGM